MLRRGTSCNHSRHKDNMCHLTYCCSEMSYFELQVSAGTMVIALLLVLFDLPFHHLHRAVSHFCVVWVSILLLGKTIYQLQTVPEGFFVCGTTYVNKVRVHIFRKQYNVMVIVQSFHITFGHLAHFQTIE